MNDAERAADCGRVSASGTTISRKELTLLLSFSKDDPGPPRAAAQKLPKGLFRKKDSAFIWCWYYVKGRAQPVKESTRTTDVEEAKRFRNARLAEHPTMRAQRISRQHVTTGDALAFYARDCQATFIQYHAGRVKALTHALGSPSRT